MIVRWRVAGELCVGVYDPELGRWKWGTHRWSWPWMRAGAG